MPAEPLALGLLRSLRAQFPRITLPEVIAFVCVAQDQGASVQDVAAAGGMAQSTASRSLRALGPPDSDWSSVPALGLVEPYLGADDGRSRALYLSPAGQRLVERLQAAAGLAAARPMTVGGAHDAH